MARRGDPTKDPGPPKNAHRLRRPTRDELRLWHHVVKDVAPIGKTKTDGGGETAEKESPVPMVPPSTTKRVKIAPPAKTEAKKKPAPPELVVGAPKDVDRRTAERLKKGQFALEARLDLHGHTQASAQPILTSFLAASQAMGRRAVLVITGKGGAGKGILKTQVPRWLNEKELREIVLAVTEARPKDGGEGALYVLLKRRR